MDANEKDLKNMMKDYKKLTDSEMKEESFEVRKYLHELSVNDARTYFAYRSKMTKSVRLNFSNDPGNSSKLWKCQDCHLLDSQRHLLICNSYSDLREGKDLNSNKDLCNYIQQILSRRTSRE